MILLVFMAPNRPKDYTYAAIAAIRGIRNTIGESEKVSKVKKPVMLYRQEVKNPTLISIFYILFLSLFFFSSKKKHAEKLFVKNI